MFSTVPGIECTAMSKQDLIQFMFPKNFQSPGEIKNTNRNSNDNSILNHIPWFFLPSGNTNIVFYLIRNFVGNIQEMKGKDT